MTRHTQLATLCYLKRGGRTLLLHRVSKKGDVHKGKWNGLGGKFKPGESAEDCVIREVREESNLRITKPRWHGTLFFPLFTPRTDWVVFIYTARRFRGRLKGSREGRAQWIDDRDVLNLNLWEGDRYFLHWLTQNKFFMAKFIYKNKKLISQRVAFVS